MGLINTILLRTLSLENNSLSPPNFNKILQSVPILNFRYNKPLKFSEPNDQLLITDSEQC